MHASALPYWQQRSNNKGLRSTKVFATYGWYAGHYDSIGPLMHMRGVPAQHGDSSIVQRSCACHCCGLGATGALC